MGIFKKLFGDSNEPGKDRGSMKPDIDKLVDSEDTNGSIIELDDYITKLCNYGESLDKLTEPQRVFFLNQSLEKEVNNGGFNQFYFNSSGDHAHETVDALKAIEAHRTAEIVTRANDQFPNKNVPKDRTSRQEIMEQIEDKADEIWGDLDNKFFEYEDDLNALNMAYIRRNRSSF